MKLEWSTVADAEMRALARASVERWGLAVALRYVADLRAAAKLLRLDPSRARPLKRGLRLFRVRSHYLIVQVDATADRLMIARVLHVGMDLERHLPEQPGPNGQKEGGSGGACSP